MQSISRACEKIERGLPSTSTIRFIPALAGEGYEEHLKQRLVAVHPRTCGGGKSPNKRICSLNGSSPHLRGRVIYAASSVGEARFIPALAGEGLIVLLRKNEPLVRIRKATSRTEASQGGVSSIPTGNARSNIFSRIAHKEAPSCLAERGIFSTRRVSALWASGALFTSPNLQTPYTCCMRFRKRPRRLARKISNSLASAIALLEANDEKGINQIQRQRVYRSGV